MKRLGSKGGLIAVAIFAAPLAVSTPALADTNPQVTPSPLNYKDAMERFKIERDLYMTEMKTRNQQIRTINMGFKNACDKASSDFKSAMSVARTPDQKNAAVAARKNSISTAIAIRDAAIAALGEEPLPPIEPVRPSQPMKAPKGKNR